MENILNIIAVPTERYFDIRNETEDGRSYTINKELKDTYIIYADIKLNNEEININTTCYVDIYCNILIPSLKDFDNSDSSEDFCIDLLSNKFIEEVEDSIEKTFNKIIGENNNE